MRNRATWRRGFGLAQIMALLLVVLPTLAFIVTFLIDYWAVMRIDNNLKLITNIATARLNNFTDLSADPDDAALQNVLSSYCPYNTALSFTDSRVSDGPETGAITVTASYTYNGTYLKAKTAVARMSTYSYNDQNATINLVCK